VFHHQELLPHNVELKYHTIVGPFGRANTGVDRRIGEGTITQVSMLLHLHLKI
jgi:hypothetical protein